MCAGFEFQSIWSTQPPHVFHPLLHILHLLAGIEVDGGRGLRRQAQDGGGAVVGAERPEPEGPNREAPVLRTIHRQWVKHTE